MNKFERRKHKRPLHPWQQKLQRLLLSGQIPEQPGHLYRLDVRHQDSCPVWQGESCTCLPSVAVDGQVLT